MNDTVMEMLAIMEGDPEALAHYGVGHLKGGHSGRYPWGSGNNPYQGIGSSGGVNASRAGNADFADRVDKMRKVKFTYTDPETGEHLEGDKAIAKSMGMGAREFRAQYSIATNERRLKNINTAQELFKQGKTTSEIARQMGVPRSTVESYLKPEAKAKSSKAMQTADDIRKIVDEKGMVDVGKGVELELNISRERLDQAVSILEQEGYVVHKGGIPQVTNPGKQTNQKVLCVPGTQAREIYDYGRVHSLTDYISRDGTTLEQKFNYPASMDSSRLKIRYAEEGGIYEDGTILIRPGKADLSLGDSRYSQVRIMVDNKYYLKGMALYGKDSDFPPGVDVIFNTNKGLGKPMEKVLKPIKDDPENPFGSLIKDADKGGQYWYDPKDGRRLEGQNDPSCKNPKLGLINKRADEGDWSEWADSLPSQFLSKQTEQLAKKQLDLAKLNTKAEYDDILRINNPTVRKHFLEKYADECDSAAADLKAAALPGQKYQVILPNSTLKDTEIYAPGYENGTQLALVRYPHGGTFEIPIVTVNNKNQLGRERLGTTPQDAVMINSRVAERLSGADFDGDTVMCIPTHDPKGNVRIQSTHALKGLEGFDPKAAYPKVPGMTMMKTKTTDNTQKEMGMISNLITDMTLGGASEDELARAVRHSMVVIDAGKHELNYKQSEIDNNIADLQKRYQRHVQPDGTVKYGGAATLISRSKGQASVEKRRGEYSINDPNSPNYNPNLPKGVKVYKKAIDLYYPDQSFDKKTRTTTYRLDNGKKLVVSWDDKKAVANTKPVEMKDPKTGKSYFVSADGAYIYRTKTRMEKTTKMDTVYDARELLSANPTKMELMYADYANTMKANANRARLEMLVTPNLEYNREMRKVYAEEVRSINKKLSQAMVNAPREREAQRRANVKRQEAIDRNADISNKDLKKKSQQALTQARTNVNSVSRRDRSIVLTDREWEAIQRGAISNSKLTDILNNSDPDRLRELATPKASSNSVSNTQVARMRAMASSNYTIAEIAKKLGVSPSTVSKYL